MAWYLPARFPVFWFELRNRLRGRAGVLLVFCYPLGIGLAVAAVAGSSGEWPDATDYAEFARNLWYTILIFQAGLLPLITPGLTAQAISSERERGTLEYLLLSPQSSIGIVLGKMTGALAQVFILLLTSMPIIAMLGATFGGVAPWEIVLVYLGLMLEALLFGGIGLLASCHAKRAGEAVLRAYSYMIGFLILCVLLFPVGLLLPIFCLPLFPALSVAHIEKLRACNPVELQMAAPVAEG